jgi:hypothetical protein
MADEGRNATEVQEEITTLLFEVPLNPSELNLRIWWAEARLSLSGCALPVLPWPEDLKTFEAFCETCRRTDRSLADI